MADVKIWEQRADEPDRAYACFLVYLQLGPGRSLERAYEAASNRVKSRRSSGQWVYYSTTYDWVARSQSFDIDALSQHGTEVVINWVQSLVKLSELAFEKITSGTVEIHSLGQLLEVINVLGNFVTPETIQAAREFTSGDFGRKVIEPGGAEEDF
jgi:hypothetical protein